MRNLTYIFIIAFLNSCNFQGRNEKIFKTDQDFVENYRKYSPDSSMLLIDYKIDIGAFGYAAGGTAILKLTDTTKDLREFTLPITLRRVKWIDNKNITAQFDIIPLLRSGNKIELKDTVVNGIKIKVSALDYINSDSHMEIVHKEISPNGKFELVAYRYPPDKYNLNFIHISIISVGRQIPKYGNYFIADMSADYILFGNWTKANELLFYSNSKYADLIQYYLVKSRQKLITK